MTNRESGSRRVGEEAMEGRRDTEGPDAGTRDEGCTGGLHGGGETEPAALSRRDTLKALAIAPLAGLAGGATAGGALDFTDAIDKLTRVPREVLESQQARKFFTAHEMATVRVLVDIVIPRDEQSGSATEAKVPEWMDNILADNQVSDDRRRLAMRGGLAWLDREAHQRFAKSFVAATPAQRLQIVEDIAWPKKAKPEHSNGVAFFNSFRDFTASGFWSSAVGAQDLKYIGNTFVPEWKGCPEAALRKLGVSY